ncbi:bifunctional metallophosphatase/5'-nucleotidase [Erysipelothrix sp. HDW6A]|uniref:5'-nucleotidase C-terminal domain-containing protein n=1 Tax=Erysipelothrix sp. HDW6A TaxID=2714928 RepID=UPI00140D1623|nr:5'-nucleotidase C-terminal domain-containing protein [Erysipelothrix sp. HDW6A]QIK56868.1 bifunctional metallophosphatase/5'-nucleotidase [Erysipelothrix sp. HDW6A]
MNRLRKFTSVLVVALMFVLVTPTAIHAEKQTEYSIIHTNDMHGRMDSDKLARLKTFKDVTKPLLMLDGGDAMQGLPVSNFSKGADMAKVMNEIGYDAMAVGNHEFDFGQAVAVGEEEGFGKVLNFPLLSSNTRKKDTNHAIFKESILFGDEKTAQSHIVERDGLVIPIVGATTPETITKTHPNNIEGLYWENPLESVTRELLKYKDKNPDFYVVVTHLGTDKETPEAWRSDYLAQKLSTQESTKDMKIVIVDGHSHSEENEKHGNVLLVQTGEHLNNVGVVTVNLSDWTKTEGKLIKFDDLVKNHEPDAKVLELLGQANDNFKAYGSKVLVKDNTVEFNGVRDFVRTRETNLGNLIADSLIDYSVSAKNKADLAVVNGGGIRSNLKAGDVTLGDVISVLPFGNIYSLIDVTGQNIYDMFEHSLRTDVQTNDDGSYKLDSNGKMQLGANGGFLHVSEGVKLTFDPLKPAGSRITELLIDNKPVDKSAHYKLATNDFLAVGGDGYTMLGGARTEGPSLDTVFANYLEANKSNLSKYADDTVQTRVIMKDVVEEGVKVDALKALLAKAEFIAKEDYTEASYTVFKEAFDEAQALLNKVEANTRILITQEIVDAATTKLQTAMDALEKVAPKPVINTKSLEALIAEASKYSKDAYTEASFTVYQKTLAEAEAILKRFADGDASVDQLVIDEAGQNILNAIAALVKAEEKKPVDKDSLPATGMNPSNGILIPLALVAAGGVVVIASRKKKNDK